MSKQTDYRFNIQHILQATKQAVVKKKKKGKLYYSVIVFHLCNYFRNKSTILITLYELLIVNIRRGSWV